MILGKKKTKVSFTIDPEAKKKLEDIAHSYGKSVAELLRELILSFLKTRKIDKIDLEVRPGEFKIIYPHAVLVIDWSTLRQLRTELIDLGKDPDEYLSTYVNEILKEHTNRPVFAPTLYTMVEKEETLDPKGRRIVRYFIEVPPSTVHVYGLEGKKIKVWISPTESVKK